MTQFQSQVPLDMTQSLLIRATILFHLDLELELSQTQRLIPEQGMT